MIELIKGTDGKWLAPQQVSLLILANSELTETDSEYILAFYPTGMENKQLDKPFLESVPVEWVPGVLTADIKAALGDKMYREYHNLYHSTRRITDDQSNETSA